MPVDRSRVRDPHDRSRRYADAPPSIPPPDVIDRVLHVTVVLTALGTAWTVALDRNPLATSLFDLVGPSAAGTARVVLAVGLVCLAAALAARPRPGAMVALAGWLGLVALATTARGEAFAYGLAVPAHLARISLPLVWLARRSRAGLLAGVDPLTLARVAVAATFIAHGAEALMGHPKFVAYIVGVGTQWHLWQLDGIQALNALVVIGVVDIAVGLALLVRPLRGVALYMAFWGGVTALSRVLYADLGATYEVFIRAAHVCLPLFVAARSMRAFTTRSRPLRSTSTATVRSSAAITVRSH